MFKSNNINGQSSQSANIQNQMSQSIPPKPNLLINNNNLNNGNMGISSPSNFRNIQQNNTNLIINSNDVGSMRFVNIRYKIYFLILLLFSLIFYLFYFTETYDKYKLSVSTYSGQVAYFSGEFNKYKKYKSQTQFINTITKNQKNIISCLNQRNGCNLLDEKTQKTLPIVRNYLQLGTLLSPKMRIVDEKKVLQHLNEFLLVENPFAQNKKRNGQFQGIDIGTPSLIKGSLYKVPISIQVTFLTKEQVLSFLDNLEKKIYWSELYDFDKTMLYKIDELNYDIMNYDVKQDVDIKLTAFYLNKKK